MSEAPSCEDCEFLRRDLEGRKRCYSPQLMSMKLAGIPAVFERDATREPSRDTAGTRKCMPEGLNFKRREFV